MKITLEFESMYEAEPYLKGLDFSDALEDFHNWLRHQLKHGDLSDEKWQFYEEIQKKFFSILDENNVILN